MSSPWFPAKKRKIGGRGHAAINWLTFGIVILLAFVVFGLGIFGFPQVGYGAGEQGIVSPALKVICGILSGCGVAGMIVLLLTWQRKPDNQQIQEIIDQVTKSEGETPKG